jgi:hypothetical protein
VDLRRNFTLKIHDPNLISDAAGRHARIAGHSTEFEACRQSGRVTRTPLPEYSGYLSRAAGRLMEVFRDEV